MTKEGRGDAPF